MITTPAPPPAHPRSCEFPVAEELLRWEPVVRGRKFVWLLAPPWDGVWTRQNHFATRLARLGAEVLYVENPCAWTSALRQHRWRALPIGRGQPAREIEPRLHVLRPPFSLPGSRRSEIIAGFNGRRLAAHVARWLAARGWTDYAAWCRIPYSVAALDHLRPSTTIYDVTDDYALFETHPTAQARVRQRERRLLARAEVVFLASPGLQQTENLRRVNTHWLPNGVDYDLFSQVAEPGPVHPTVAALPKPVLGYVGLTSPWIDFALLETLARRWPGQVLMIGPIAASVEKRARAIRGLVWGGFVPQQELVPWLRGMDVCLMPYEVNERTRRASPLKLWEYAATGKPIVAVDLPAFDAARDLVDVAHDRRHFVQLVEQRLRHGPRVPVATAQAAARQYSWDGIFGRLMEQLENRLARAA